MEPELLPPLPRSPGTCSDLLFSVTSNSPQGPTLQQSLCRCSPYCPLCFRSGCPPPEQPFLTPNSSSSHYLLRDTPLTLSWQQTLPLFILIEFCTSLIIHSHSCKVLFNCILIFLEKKVSIKRLFLYLEL